MRIWAPRARRLELVLGETRIPGRAAPGGVWFVPAVQDGELYALSVDGGPPIPDPRSPWQPEGVHGRSCWIDQGPLRPEAPHVALRDAVIYELHVGTFSAAGTFVGAIAHLDLLVELGVTHVELMPVAQFSGHHGWGYDGVDLFAPHAPYGGPSGLRELIRQCHLRGLAVLIDVVHNHFGPEGAYWNELGPYTTPRHHTPWGEAINLDDEGGQEVRRFLIDSALAWLRDYGADGLRLDALHSLIDTSERHFVAELVDEVRALEREQGRNFLLIGEYDDHDPTAVRERAAAGWGLDAHWNDDFHHALHALLTGERAGYYGDFADREMLPRVLERGYGLDGGYAPYRHANHGQPFGELPRDRLVGYIQSHDQVGNRARGERLHQLAGLERTRMAAAMLFVAPFVPMLFQGEEWAASTPFLYFAELESADLREAVRQGRVAEHAGAGWRGASAPDPTARSTRDASVLRWEERGEPAHAAMLAWYRALIAARRTHAALREPAPETTRARLHGDVLAIERGELALVCNLGAEPARVDLGDVLLASTGLASASELPALACALVRARRR